MTPGRETEVVLHAIGWGFIHALWIGATIALATGVVLRLVGRANPAGRYRVALGALVVTAALPLAIGAYVVREYIEHADWVGRTTTELRADPGETRRAADEGGDDVGRRVVARHASMYAPPLSANAVRVLGVAAGTLAVLALLRVASRLSRLSSACITLRRLRRPMDDPESTAWRSDIDRLRHRMGIGRPVDVGVSSRVPVPMVTGIRRPLVLIPSALRETLPAEHADAVLAHELAHVLRGDLPTNAVHRVAEALASFNPAALWLSRVLEEERECATDLLACRSLGTPHSEYARALTALATGVRDAEGLAVAVVGQQSLLGRVRRLSEATSRRSGGAELLAVGALLVLCGLLGASGLAPAVRASVALVMEHDLHAQVSSRGTNPRR